MSTRWDRWNLLAGVLSHEEQLKLFSFINERDATDWEKLERSPCMNPSPKTLQLVQQQQQRPGEQATLSPTLRFGPDDEAGVVVMEMIQKAIQALGVGWSSSSSSSSQDQASVSASSIRIKSLSISAIRYCSKGSNPSIGSCFPPHIDHCNDGSWVFLFSLGCTATFYIKSPDMDDMDRDQRQRQRQRYTFEMKSGDVLVFDPSSEAAILHGVDGVARSCGEEVSPTGEEFGGGFEVLRHSRFGVQCRVSFME